MKKDLFTAEGALLRFFQSEIVRTGKKINPLDKYLHLSAITQVDPDVIRQIETLSRAYRKVKSEDEYNMFIKKDTEKLEEEVKEWAKTDHKQLTI